MTQDGGLRSLFNEKLPMVHWVPLESGLTQKGIPDHNGCYVGVEVWIEYKLTSSNKVRIDPFQVAWHERAMRAGRRTILAVRKKHDGGPRLGKPIDELHLYFGFMMRNVFEGGLDYPAIKVYTGGPSKWNWNLIRTFIFGPLNPDGKSALIRKYGP